MYWLFDNGDLQTAPVDGCASEWSYHTQYGSKVLENKLLPLDPQGRRDQWFLINLVAPA